MTEATTATADQQAVNKKETPSWSSQVAAWVASHIDAVGLVSIAGLFYVNFMFNYDYGLLMASGTDNETKFAFAFAFLESSALFLAGYLGVKSEDNSHKAVARYTFYFLIALSLWTALASILASDERATWDGDQIEIQNTLDAIGDVDRQIQIMETRASALTSTIGVMMLNWTNNNDMTLDEVMDKLTDLREQKSDLSKQLKGHGIEREQFAIFDKVAAFFNSAFGRDWKSESIQLISRLVFGFAIIWSYGVAFRILVAKVEDQKSKK